MDNEEILIKRAVSGDNEAFREIVEKYKIFIFSVCKSIIGNPYDSENAAQEAFIQIYRSLNQYEFKGFKTWISKIALHKAIDYKRKIAKHDNVTYLDEVGFDKAGDEGNYCDKLIKKENSFRIRQLMNEMPNIYSDVIFKYYMEHKSYQSIAVEENISIKAVESRLYRGKKILKSMWEEVEHNEAF